MWQKLPWTGTGKKVKKSGDENINMTVKLVIGERVRLIMAESLVLYKGSSAISELEEREIMLVYTVTSMVGNEAVVYVQHVYSTSYSN